MEEEADVVDFVEVGGGEHGVGGDEEGEDEEDVEGVGGEGGEGEQDGGEDEFEGEQEGVELAESDRGLAGEVADFLGCLELFAVL